MSHTLDLPFVANDAPPIDGEVRLDWIAELFWLMGADPAQKRPELIWDETLEGVALTRVKKMAHEGWSSHVDPAGKGPDWYVKQQGYRLPSWYYVPTEGDASNHIESLFPVGADGTALGVWNGFLGHESHRYHLEGDGEFAKQTHVGIAVYYLATSKEKLYVSILTAPPQEAA